MGLTDGLDAIKALLSCVQADGIKDSHVNLEEKSENAKLKKLTVSGLEKGIIVLATDEGRKTDKFPVCMSPLFSVDGKYDQNRACDAVFIKKMDDGYHVCYVELKSDSPSGYEGQFKSTKCFIAYVCELSKNLCEQPIKITRERYVVFHTDSKNGKKSGKKLKTRFSHLDANTPSSPDMFCVRDNEKKRLLEFF
jgi:hypothetical protein